MTRVAVFGTGSWGTAFAAVLADAGSQVRMWGRRAELVDQINQSHVNGDYLPDLLLPAVISATTDPQEAVDGVGIVVLAVPSQTLRANLEQWAGFLPPHGAIVSLMKGVELGTTRRMSQVIEEVAGVGPERIVVVSGPNLALEIAAKQPAASVVACVDESMAERVALACAAPYFRPYTNTDVVGTELGGAVKNVIALAVGMAKGMGMGDNSQASIITRGLECFTLILMSKKSSSSKIRASLSADSTSPSGISSRKRLGGLYCVEPYSVRLQACDR